MEAFYASVSGVVATFGGSMFFYILLRKDILRLEDRVIRLDERLREVVGDMKAVNHQLRITEGPPADPEPTQPAPPGTNPASAEPRSPRSRPKSNPLRRANDARAQSSSNR